MAERVQPFHKAHQSIDLAEPTEEGEKRSSLVILGRATGGTDHLSVGMLVPTRDIKGLKPGINRRASRDQEGALSDIGGHSLISTTLCPCQLSAGNELRYVRDCYRRARRI